ncbi:MAG: hypothetical protein IKS99_00800 [Firmicutes bacterium]|nr:hypothetical protein [Bacillota bacterium]
MQLLERVKNCNGCGACVVPCKHNAVKLFDRNSEEAAELILKYADKQSAEAKAYKASGRYGSDGPGAKKIAVLNEGACDRCNACVLFCPIFNPVELPVFEEWYEYDPAFDERDMPKLYRETMRKARAGQHTEFVGTLCQIAALKSLNGDKIPQNLILKPLLCSKEKRDSEPCCRECAFY